MAHVRQARPDPGLDFQAIVLKYFQVFPLRVEAERKDVVKRDGPRSNQIRFVEGTFPVHLFPGIKKPANVCCSPCPATERPKVGQNTRKKMPANNDHPAD